MSPKLVPGQLVLATNLFHRITAGEVYIFVHEGREKIKRIERITGDHIFFVGDNLDFSSDSRHFGWVEKDCIVAKVIWPRVHN